MLRAQASMIIGWILIILAEHVHIAILYLEHLNQNSTIWNPSAVLDNNSDQPQPEGPCWLGPNSTKNNISDKMHMPFPWEAKLIYLLVFISFPLRTLPIYFPQCKCLKCKLFEDL